MMQNFARKKHNMKHCLITPTGKHCGLYMEGKTNKKTDTFSFERDINISGVDHRRIYGLMHDLQLHFTTDPSLYSDKVSFYYYYYYYDITVNICLTVLSLLFSPSYLAIDRALLELKGL